MIGRIWIACLFFAAACVCGGELRIINPCIMNSDVIEREVTIYSNPQIVEKKGVQPDGTTSATLASQGFSQKEIRQMTFHRVIFRFMIYNGDSKTCRLQTRGFGSGMIEKGAGPADNRVLGRWRIPMELTGVSLETQDLSGSAPGIPRFPLVQPESEMGVVSLHPGEGCVVLYELELKSLYPGDRFQIRYAPKNFSGRFDIWEGELFSEPFAYSPPKRP